MLLEQEGNLSMTQHKLVVEKIWLLPQCPFRSTWAEGPRPSLMPSPLSPPTSPSFARASMLPDLPLPVTPSSTAERSNWLEGGWIAYLKFLQTSLSKWVSKTNGEAILALAQLSYASHLYKLVQG